MVQYVKVRLNKKSDGSFAGNAVLVKRNSTAVPGVAHFVLVWKEGSFPFPFTTSTSSVRIGQNEDFVTFNANNGNLRLTDVFTGSDMDSFETLLISERLRSDSVFNNHTVIIADRTIMTANGVFSINFDDLFAIEEREATVSGGTLIKPAYTTDETYSGFSSYHHNQRVHRFNTPINNDKPYRIGVELEVYAKTREDYNKITTSRTNWFQCESDGSLTQYDYPIEIKTIPLRPIDATSVDFWAEPMRELKKRAFSKVYVNGSGQKYPVTSTGLHVHISKEILGSTETERQKNLDKLTYFYTYFVEDDPDAHRKNTVICGREKGYGVDENGAKTDLGDFVKMIGYDKISDNNDAFNKVALSVKERTANQRGDINIKNWNTYGTIEFRKGKGAISKIRLAAICTWWEQMCLYVKNTNPRNLSFEDFFNGVCRDYPSVAYFFQQDDEG